MAVVPETLTETLDNLYTTTWKHIKNTAVDNIFDSTALLAWMRRRGRIEDQVGGRHIEESVMYAKNSRVSWAVRGTTVDMSDEEFLTETKWDWKYLYAPIVRFGTDDHKNRGKMQMINYAEAKLENARTSLEDTLETTLFAGAASGDEFDGLQHLVQDDPTSSTVVGNINQSDNSWWQNQLNSMTGVSFATSGVDRMRTMFNDTGKNKKSQMIDIIVTGQTVFEYYEDAILGKFQFENKELADLGFTNQTFKQKPMIWSPACGTRMYFLNTRFIRLVKDPGLFMDMTSLIFSAKYKSSLINGESPIVH